MQCVLGTYHRIARDAWLEALCKVKGAWQKRLFYHTPCFRANSYLVVFLVVCARGISHKLLDALLLILFTDE